MNGLNKFKTEIKAEVQKSCLKDERKKKLIQGQADAIIKHIESVCDEEYDKLLNQPHKSFRRMWSFVTKNAKEYAIDNCAMVADNVVYGWIDEYVGLDDKKEVEEEEKAKAKATETPTRKSGKSVQKEIAKIQAEINERHEIESADQISIFDLM